jgi:hypothetical protein
LHGSLPECNSEIEPFLASSSVIDVRAGLAAALQTQRGDQRKESGKVMPTRRSDLLAP